MTFAHFLDENNDTIFIRADTVISVSERRVKGLPLSTITMAYGNIISTVTVRLNARHITETIERCMYPVVADANEAPW